MKLSSSDRSAIPAGQFGLPAQRKYPMPDASHAANAKARASQQFNAGRLSGAQKAQIDKRADAKLHPRVHALSMASASHLHTHGYISAAQHQSIKSQAQAKMNAAKAAPPAVFGSLVPR